MGATIAVIVIGVLYPASFAVFVISFTRLRSDLHAGFDRLETRFDEIGEKFDEKFDDHLDRLDARFDRMDEKFDGHFDRLEAKFDRLDMTLARIGHLTGPDNSSGADD